MSKRTVLRPASGRRPRAGDEITISFLSPEICWSDSSRSALPPAAAERRPWITAQVGCPARKSCGIDRRAAGFHAGCSCEGKAQACAVGVAARLQAWYGFRRRRAISWPAGFSAKVLPRLCQTRKSAVRRRTPMPSLVRIKRSAARRFPRPRDCSERPSSATTTLTMLMSLMRMFRLGPLVS